MKLAEALKERADIQTRIAQLRNRLSLALCSLVAGAS